MNTYEAQLRALVSDLGWSMTITPRAPTKEEANEDRKSSVPWMRYSAAINDANGHEVLRCNYSCGSAYPESWFWDELTESGRMELCRLTGEGPQPPHRKGFMTIRNQTIFEKKLSDIVRNKWTPSLAAVMGALALDCNMVEPYLPDAFEAWASDLGGNPDSIRERDSFFAMVNARRALARAMPPSTFAKFCELGANL